MLHLVRFNLGTAKKPKSTNVPHVGVYLAQLSRVLWSQMGVVVETGLTVRFPTFLLTYGPPILEPHVPLVDEQ